MAVQWVGIGYEKVRSVSGGYLTQPAPPRFLGAGDSVIFAVTCDGPAVPYPSTSPLLGTGTGWSDDYSAAGAYGYLLSAATLSDSATMPPNVVWGVSGPPGTRTARSAYIAVRGGDFEIVDYGPMLSSYVPAAGLVVAVTQASVSPTLPSGWVLRDWVQVGTRGLAVSTLAVSSAGTVNLPYDPSGSTRSVVWLARGDVGPDVAATAPCAAGGWTISLGLDMQPWVDFDSHYAAAGNPEDIMSGGWHEGGLSTPGSPYEGPYDFHWRGFNANITGIPDPLPVYSRAFLRIGMSYSWSSPAGLLGDTEAQIHFRVTNGQTFYANALDTVQSCNRWDLSDKPAADDMWHLRYETSGVWLPTYQTYGGGATPAFWNWKDYPNGQIFPQNPPGDTRTFDVTHIINSGVSLSAPSFTKENGLVADPFPDWDGTLTLRGEVFIGAEMPDGSWYVLNEYDVSITALDLILCDAVPPSNARVSVGMILAN